ncbi:hypothetical protein ACFYV5_02935 [Streptomyces sp. NPDC003035]|uniref:hypothetical protein n=1 Tax=Streptomyces sp. NPDC003035 TaxID=3364676 RepID=UPI0036C8EF25
MSPASVPRTEPAAPAGGAARDAPGHRSTWHRVSALGRAVVAVLLVSAALFGACGGGSGPGGTEARPAASGAAEPGAETHDVAESEAAAPGSRGRARRKAARRGGGRRRGPGPDAPEPPAVVPAPVPLPRDRARRCVVMRC